MGLLKIYKGKDLTPSLRKELLQRESALDQDAFRIVEEILSAVEAGGEAAVIDFTKRFDGVELKELLATPAEFERAERALDPELKRAFEKAADHIRQFHAVQKRHLTSDEITVDGTRLGYKYVPVDGAGVYVPGGKASYPSSVLMGLIPASLAGVSSPLVITPPDKSGSVMDAVLFCAKLGGSSRVLKAGGAQGVAAAAMGLAGKPAQVIAGPGNRYVTAAKSLLVSRGLIRMDMPAGPSEVIVIADSTANPLFVASDMLSQAEHGEDSPAILLTDSMELALAVEQELKRGMEDRPARGAMKRTSIERHSYAVVFDDLVDAIHFSNDYGPEHLEICTKDPMKDLASITSAGSVFLGNYAPVALGDYYSGTNHVLPTGGSAGFYSGLGVETFMKRITYQYPTEASLRAAMDPIVRMSTAEGLDQEHGHSVQVRFHKEIRP